MKKRVQFDPKTRKAIVYGGTEKDPFTFGDMVRLCPECEERGIISLGGITVTKGSYFTTLYNKLVQFVTK